MILPLYKIDQPSFETDAHRGLRFEKFFNRYDSTWKVMEEKTQWLEEIAKDKVGDTSALTNYCQRRRTLVEKLGGQSAEFVTQWHFATGLGLPHPIENGFAWHPTLGTPYLAGSAVKGLMRTWLEVWEENEQTREKKLRWLGSTDDKNPQAGELICFDAIPMAPVKLITDVMTPHYGEWYEQGGKIRDYKQEPDKLPADWQEPNPVVFLAVDKQTSFLFSIAHRHRKQHFEIDEALKVLKNALAWLGAGAKTATGYGYMNMKEESLPAVPQIKVASPDVSMSPLEQKMQEVITANPSQQGYISLLQSLRQGRWECEEEKKGVAQFIRKQMEEEKVWKEATKMKKPEKDKDCQRTLEVLKYLN